MSFHCFYEESLDTYFIHGVGEGSFQSTREGLLQMQKDPNWAKASRVVADLRLVHFEPTEEGVERLAKVIPLKEMLVGHKTAFIVNRGMQYGMLRVFLTLSAVAEVVQVFTDWVPAVQWLGLQLTY